jgi:hypothetical protein
VELCHDQTDRDGTQVANDKPAGPLELIEIRHTFDAVFSSALSTSRACGQSRALPSIRQYAP